MQRMGEDECRGRVASQRSSARSAGVPGDRDVFSFRAVIWNGCCAAAVIILIWICCSTAAKDSQPGTWVLVFPEGTVFDLVVRLVSQ
jgi:hypothetical protein